MTKFSISQFSSILALVFSAGTLLAQGEPAASEGTPQAASQQEVVAAPSHTEQTPTEEVLAFFEAVKKKKIDEAYGRLLKGSNIGLIEKDVRLLKTKTREVIDQAGEIAGCELVQKDVVGSGNHLVRLNYLSLGKKFPILWTFTFYRAETTWKLIDIRLSDSLPAYFEAKTADSKP